MAKRGVRALAALRTKYKNSKKRLTDKAMAESGASSATKAAYRREKEAKA